MKRSITLSGALFMLMSLNFLGTAVAMEGPAVAMDKPEDLAKIASREFTEFQEAFKKFIESITKEEKVITEEMIQYVGDVRQKAINFLAVTKKTKKKVFFENYAAVISKLIGLGVMLQQKETDEATKAVLTKALADAQKTITEVIKAKPSVEPMPVEKVEEEKPEVEEEVEEEVKEEEEKEEVPEEVEEEKVPEVTPVAEPAEEIMPEEEKVETKKEEIEEAAAAILETEETPEEGEEELEKAEEEE